MTITNGSDITDAGIPGRAEIVMLGGVLLLAGFLRFYGLAEQGLRTSDGGLYAHQAWKSLLGQPNAIKDKPGHTLITMVSYKMLGVKMSSPLFFSAASGMMFVLFTWLLTRRHYGPATALATTLLASVTPYFLVYHRGANSEVNLLTGLIVSLYLYDRVLSSPASEPRKYFGWAAATGVAFGVTLSINYSMATTFVPACIAFVIHSVRERVDWKKVCACSLTVTVGLLVGAAVPCAIMWDNIEHKELFRQILYHQKGFSESSLSARILTLPVTYCGAAFVLLGLFGLWRMSQRRKPFEVFVLVQSAVMVLAYCRSVLPYPRIYLPLCLPLMFGCAAALHLICTSLSASKVHRGLALAGSLLLCVGFQARELYATVTLKSGYQESIERLFEDSEEFRRGGTTHTWWGFETFTGRRFGYASDLLAEKFAAPDWEQRVPRLFRSWRRQGYTHIVLDYLLWNRLKLEHSPRFEQFVASFPPTHQVANSAARHRQTVAEDGGLPAAGTNPPSEFIYIWRLSDFPSEPVE